MNLEVMGTKFANKQKLKINLIDKFFLLSRYMIRTEGIFSFWRGIKPNVLRSGVSSGLYFYQLRMFENIFRRFKKVLKKDSKYNFLYSEESINFWTSAVARSTTGLLLNPLTIIRTRAELIGSKNYAHIGQSFKRIYHKEGFRSFFKGGMLTIFEEFPFGGIFNLVYEAMNRHSGINFKNSSSRTHSNRFRIFQTEKAQLLINATVAGIIASVLTHPIEIAKTKIQSQKQDFTRNKNSSVILSICRDTYHRFGIKGFLFGLAPRLLKKTFVNATVFFLYEILSKRTVQGH